MCRTFLEKWSSAKIWQQAATDFLEWALFHNKINASRAIREILNQPVSNLGN
jgi:hypothetical protein